MNEALWLKQTAERFPDAPALAHGATVVSTYKNLVGNVARIAGGIHQSGQRAGSRIAIFAANMPPYITALYSIWWAGCAATPINAKLHHDEVAYILRHAEITMIFVSPDTAETAQKAADACGHDVVIIPLNTLQAMAEDEVPPYDGDDNDLAWLFYTSGTTGRPKGAMLSWRNLDQMSTRYLETVADITRGDSIVHAAPLSHGSGLYTLPHMRCGACQVIPESGGFDVEELTRLLDHWQGVSLFAAPTMVNRWVRSDVNLTEDRLASLKVIVYGGAPMYAHDAMEALERFGPRLAQIYGQGESPMTITCLSRDDIADRDHPQWQHRLASVGAAFENVDVAIKDDHGQISTNGVGEVLVRGAIVMNGYWNAPEATAAAIQDGWLHTGDIGAIDDDGYVTLMDRSKDLIISGGSNIYPREVEEVLLTHPEVEDVSVIGRLDEDWGEIVVAYYVGTASTDDLDTLCLNKIARFKRPKDYIRIDALPKSHYGKILKSALREMDQQQTKGKTD